MYRIASVVCLIATATTVAAKGAAPRITNEDSFSRAIAALRADAADHDKFKQPVETYLQGHSFKIALPIVSELGAFFDTSFDYKGGKLELGLRPSKAERSLGAARNSVPVLVVTSGTKSLGKYVGQNAFGATARVSSYKNSSSGIALVSSPKLMTRSNSYAGGPSYAGWWIELPLPPNEARTLAETSDAVVEGTYAKLPWGEAGFCDFDASSATLSKPTDFYRQRCFLGANVTRIAFTNRVTGAILKEWTTISDPALGPELWGGVRVGMNKYQLKASQPSISDAGYIETDGGKVYVAMAESGVSKVEISLPGASGKPLLDALAAKLGKPVSFRCGGLFCEAKWLLAKDVAAYLRFDGRIIYQLNHEAPPASFFP